MACCADGGGFTWSAGADNGGIPLFTCGDIRRNCSCNKLKFACDITPLTADDEVGRGVCPPLLCTLSLSLSLRLPPALDEDDDEDDDDECLFCAAKSSNCCCCATALLSLSFSSSSSSLTTLTLSVVAPILTVADANGNDDDDDAVVVCVVVELEIDWGGVRGILCPVVIVDKLMLLLSDITVILLDDGPPASLSDCSSTAVFPRRVRVGKDIMR
jgi:hypothetical protein